MEIKVNSIPPEGQNCSEVYAPENLDLTITEIKFTQPIEADYRIVREGDELFVTAVVKTSLEFTCVRCLENVECPLRKEYTFNYKVKDRDTIDTIDDLRQEFILDYPLKPLCKPDCLGLCPKCGENLNKVKCNC